MHHAPADPRRFDAGGGDHGDFAYYDDWDDEAEQDYDEMNALV